MNALIHLLTEKIQNIVLRVHYCFFRWTNTHSCSLTRSHERVKIDSEGEIEKHFLDNQFSRENCMTEEKVTLRWSHMALKTILSENCFSINANFNNIKYLKHIWYILGKDNMFFIYNWILFSISFCHVREFYLKVILLEISSSIGGVHSSHKQRSWILSVSNKYLQSHFNYD